ncbi:hypothetical protein LSS_03104 [Leptospira santarosai serovar Shermani str. LT 821]|uniref:Uncharacterized protein n=1 Tax=Leptospira santarosai serovar Shermani str. LT 821 TaxID=758847 RepID=K8YG61_9LEPT|nr:hypothetical protein LSS_03104 [Leptospira santarosai serovar Shermani str. LT 821]
MNRHNLPSYFFGSAGDKPTWPILGSANDENVILITSGPMTGVNTNALQTGSYANPSPTKDKQ